MRSAHGVRKPVLIGCCSGLVVPKTRVSWACALPAIMSALETSSALTSVFIEFLPDRTAGILQPSRGARLHIVGVFTKLNDRMLHIDLLNMWIIGSILRTRIVPKRMREVRDAL